MFRVAQHFVTSLFTPFLPERLTSDYQQPAQQPPIPFDNPLFAAVRNGNAFEVSKYTLYRDFDPDVCDERGNSLLIWAACGGHLHLVNMLKNHGASLDHQGEAGYTALMFAVYHGHWRVVDSLLAHGANPDAQCDGGDTALHILARFVIAENQDNPELSRADREIFAHIVNAFIQAGADLQIRNGAGMTPAEVAEFCANNQMMMLLPQPQQPVMQPGQRTEDAYGVEPMDLSVQEEGGREIALEDNADEELEEEGLGELFQDPVSLDDLRDPICLPNGMTYSRATLQSLFARSEDGAIRDPQTRDLITADVLQFKPNIILQQCMERERAKHAEKRARGSSGGDVEHANSENEAVRGKRLRHFGRMFNNQSAPEEEEFEVEAELGLRHGL